ncbi:MEDS domain-containing protein [Fredinandcohnia sp. 179-A 10B2 NHS]|uniref:MEDS domain-containing protein n=1 Tax=Fredinandcohnia sp. 179-A 10B2 NHS TaxID=3235176 RepID=UPI0039A16CD6
MDTLIPLTSSLKINQGSHVLYFYNSIDGYIRNACSFIVDGINLGHQIVFIEQPEMYELILNRIGPIDKEKLHFVNNYEFYQMYQDFHFERVLHNLKNIIDPFVENESMARIWGLVDWKDQDNIIEKLHTYECKCDITVSGLGYTTVCAYDSKKVPSTILLEMLKSHEYMMTDDSLFRSSLYKSSNKNNPTAFPSLSVQTTIDSEMDLYRKKLDFVHVVSHEVRNPLTVIKAYATLLEDEETEDQRLSRLRAIKNYAVVIDNEISHIINTEQMLSTDALWQKTLIKPTEPINQVIEIMKIKAQTQGITLTTKTSLSGREYLFGNIMGLKMIVSNIVSNAIKYSYEGKTVTLLVEVDGTSLVFTVIDEGVGMSKDHLEKLYKKYEKINQEQSGQGIGLFMVKKLVDHFEGTIEVKSELGVGTTFQVYLPLYK